MIYLFFLSWFQLSGIPKIFGALTLKEEVA
jgi:hypothetical protein